MRHRILWLFAVATVIAGCGSDSTVTVVNQEPSITFAFNKLAVPKGIQERISVVVSDPDEDDALTVSWSFTDGTFTPVPGTSNTSVDWTPPTTVGSVIVKVTVSDGEASAFVEEEILVGTRVSSSNALTTYLEANSPYILAPPGTSPNILIPFGANYNVEAGVQLLIDTPGTTIDVEGTWTVVGTAVKPIVIRPNDRTLRCQDGRGWWEGINVTNDDVNPGASPGTLTMSYAEVTYGQEVIRVWKGATLTLTNTLITCAGSAGVRMAGPGVLTVDACEITNNKLYGIQISSLTTLPTSISITGSDLSINENTGLEIDINDTLLDVPITLTGNRFSFNLVHGVSLKRASEPVISNNSFSFNGAGSSNLFLDSGFPGGASLDTLVCANNYWTQSTLNGIESSITDSVDDASVGTRVIVTPWLTTDPWVDN